jgi:hypothetical protein
MVGHEIKNNLDVSRVRGLKQLIEVSEGAEQRVDGAR